MIDILRYLFSTNRFSCLFCQKLVFAILFIFATFVTNTVYAEIIGCKVGDTSAYVSPQGYWQVVGAPQQGKCIIPGAPHPDSAFLHGFSNGAFRIEGRYRVDTVLIGGVSACTPGECPSCISGFGDWMCNAYSAYGAHIENSMCVLNNGSCGGKAYTCFTDTSRVTLLEWKCNQQTPPESPNIQQNFGLPCPL